MVQLSGLLQKIKNILLTDVVEIKMILDFVINTLKNGFNLKEAERQLMSEDTKKKMSESKKGEKNSFWGKKHSEETIERIREKCRQHKPTEEMKEKMREAMDISKWTEEKRKSYYEKQIAAHERRTQEEKERIREKAKRTRKEWSDEKREEIRKKMSEKSTGRKHTDDAKKKVSEANRGHRHTEESKEKMRIAAVEREEKKRAERLAKEASGEIVKTTYSEERKAAAREGFLRYLENRKLAKALLDAAPAPEKD